MKLSDRVKAYAKMQSEASDYFSYAWWDKPKNVPIAELLRLAEEVEENVRRSVFYSRKQREKDEWSPLWLFGAMTEFQHMNRARQAKLRLLRLAVKHGVAEEMGLL